MYNNREGLEEKRAEAIEKAISTLSDILDDNKASLAEKIKAASVLDGISDTIVKVNIHAEEHGFVEKTANNLTKQLKRLAEED